MQQVLGQIQNRIAVTSSDATLAQLESQTAAIETRVNQVVEVQASQLAGVSTALKPYAFTSRHPGTASQRRAQAALLAQSAAIQAQLAPAQAVASQASYTFSQIAERRRESFSARVLERSPSPVSPNFWSGLASDAYADAGRVAILAQREANVAAHASEPQAGLGLAACLALGLIMLFPVRRLLRRLGHRIVGQKRATQGLARTAAAAWMAVVDAGLPMLAALLLYLGAQWGGLLSRQADALAGAAVYAVAWSSAILAIGRALAGDRDTDRRLLTLSDETAGRIGVSLWAVALVTGAGFLLTRLNYVIGASLAATIAANCVVSLAYAAAAGLILVSFGRARAPSGEEEPQPGADEARSPAWTLVSLTLTGAIMVTVGAVFAGYTTLAALVSNQIFWLSLIAAVTYLLLRFVDDLCEALFRPRGRASRLLIGLFSLRGSSVRQTGLLIAAALQLLIIIAALGLALTPFGESGDLLFSRLGQLGQTVRIGSATISPMAIATGIGTFILGMAIVHMARGWLVRRYLPVTGWDIGLRTSVSTGLGYLGVAIVLLCAFAATGLGVAQIALIASALSVGIGFGLQQVVQNLAAGIILLVERPVKVGDWVKVGDVEGDIRRIRVRATEIQSADRSTIFVPNADLITKQVQNKTLGDPRGRIQLQISVSYAADARKAADEIIAVAKAHAEVLADPAPNVFIDALPAAGGVNLNAFVFVANPRHTYRIRSDLYYALIEALEKQGVSLATPTPPPATPATSS